MDWELYKKYGEYNNDGYYITNHEKWDYYAKRPKLYRKKKILAWCGLLIPIGGIIVTSEVFEEMGLSCF